jgi:hypothetical protein
LVKAAAGAPFLEGAPKQQLQRVFVAVGVDQVAAWLEEAPGGLKIPRLVDWLEDQMHRPDPELLERIRSARSEPEPVAEPAVDPAGPRYVEFTGHQHDEPAAPAAVRTLVHQARTAVRGSTFASPDDTMNSSTGGAHP